MTIDPERLYSLYLRIIQLPVSSLRTRPPEVVGPVLFLSFRRRGRYHFDFASFIQRKRSERPCPNDLESLDSMFGQLNRAKPRSGLGPHVLAAWVSKFPRSRR